MPCYLGLPQTSGQALRHRAPHRGAAGSSSTSTNASSRKTGVRFGISLVRQRFRSAASTAAIGTDTQDVQKFLKVGSWGGWTYLSMALGRRNYCCRPSHSSATRRNKSAVYPPVTGGRGVICADFSEQNKGWRRRREVSGSVEVI